MPLPGDWQSYVDPVTGLAYYGSTKLQRTVWHRPVDTAGNRDTTFGSGGFSTLDPAALAGSAGAAATTAANRAFLSSLSDLEKARDDLAASVEAIADVASLRLGDSAAGVAAATAKPARPSVAAAAAPAAAAGEAPAPAQQSAGGGLFPITEVAASALFVLPTNVARYQITLQPGVTPVQASNDLADSRPQSRAPEGARRGGLGDWVDVDLGKSQSVRHVVLTVSTRGAPAFPLTLLASDKPFPDRPSPTALAAITAAGGATSSSGKGILAVTGTGLPSGAPPPQPASLFSLGAMRRVATWARHIQAPERVAATSPAASPPAAESAETRVDITDFPEDFKARYIRVFSLSGKVNPVEIHVYPTLPNMIPPAGAAPSPSSKGSDRNAQWIELRKAGQGQVFYFCPSLDATSWVRPSAERPGLVPHPKAFQLKPGGSLDLPGDWLRIDPAEIAGKPMPGEPYYYSPSIKRSQWKKPED